MAASTHSRKKAYQSSKITTFFTPSSSAPGLTTSPTPTIRPPPPPSHVQSSLLNVGMRVRKSVPEGYKTKSPSSSQPTTPAYSQMHAPAPAHGYFPSSQDAYAPPSSAPPALQSLPAVRERELQPFCGLHSTGSWSSQQSQPAPASGYAITSSTISAEPDGRKRRYDEEEDDYEAEMEREMDEIFSLQERRIAPLKGRPAGIAAQRTPGTPGDFDDGDVRFLVMDMEE